MLVTHKNQTEGFKLASLQQFTDELAPHCLEFYPHLCNRLEGIQGETLAEVAPYLAGPMRMGSRGPGLAGRGGEPRC
jgi:hypothetical protein